MSSFIELLESRQLLSASLSTVTQDAAVLQSNSHSISADLAAWKQQSAKAVKALFADARHGTGGHSSKPLVQKFSRDELDGFAKVSKDITQLLTVTVRDTRAIVADLMKIQANSTPALQTKLKADIARLKSQTATRIAAANTDAQAINTKVQTDALALLALPTLNADTNKAKTALAAGMQTVMTDLTTLSATVTKFVTDASA